MSTHLATSATQNPRGRLAAPMRPPIRKQLWFWVVVAIHRRRDVRLVAPSQPHEAKWLADGFLQLVKTITAPCDLPDGS